MSEPKCSLCGTSVPGGGLAMAQHLRTCTFLEVPDTDSDEEAILRSDARPSASAPQSSGFAHTTSAGIHSLALAFHSL